jgi:hypothetical protein
MTMLYDTPDKGVIEMGWQAEAPAPRGTDAFVCQPSISRAGPYHV